MKKLFYRGIGGDCGQGNYYTEDKDFALQFTYSGRDSELKRKIIDTELIYTLSKLPKAVNDKEIDNAIAEAKTKGYKAITVDEGKNMPNSIFIFDFSIFD